MQPVRGEVRGVREEGGVSDRVTEFLEFMEAHDDLRRCSPIYLLSRTPEHLLPVAEVFVEQLLLYGTGDPADEPQGVLRSPAAAVRDLLPPAGLLGAAVREVMDAKTARM